MSWSSIHCFFFFFKDEHASLESLKFHRALFYVCMSVSFVSLFFPADLR